MRTPVQKFGALLHADGIAGTRFIVGTSAATCAVRLFREDGTAIETIPLERTEDRIFQADLASVEKGARYKFVLDGEEATDPFARSLPDGLDHPARVDTISHAWSHDALGAPEDLTIYELHVGTFTAEGTYAGAKKRLEHIADLGVSAIELMPVASFPGARGWGYDGVAHYAPYAPYGGGDDFAAFVDAAHALHLSVILDVVYNHFGPRGNWLKRCAPEAFKSREASAWGEAPNFDNELMRAYVLGNVRYWFEELRVDGLRIDATHTMKDRKHPHILEEIAQIAHAQSPRRFVIAEDDRNDQKVARKLGMDAIWADDLHHQIHVAITGESDGYYAAYKGRGEDIAKTINDGWFYSGELYPPTRKLRGTKTHELEASVFVHCLQNHDQVGNRAFGDRLNAPKEGERHDAFAAATLLLLTLPTTPLLFMGQEWAATTPFLYFTDHDEDFGEKITEGRRREFASFKAFSSEEGRTSIPDPQAESTFLKSRLDWTELQKPSHAKMFDLVRALLYLRAIDPVLRDRSRARMRAWSQGELVIVDRWSDEGARRMIANLTAEKVSLHSDLLRRATLMISSSSATVNPKSPLSSASATIPPFTSALFARRELE